jgi:hypothetical protein
LPGLPCGEAHAPHSRNVAASPPQAAELGAAYAKPAPDKFGLQRMIGGIEAFITEASR